MMQSQKPAGLQQALEKVRNQHKELLSQMEGPEGADVNQVRAFLNILAEAGTTTEDVENRSLLQELIDYWSSFIDNKTGEYPVVQLQPFLETSISEQEHQEVPSTERQKQEVVQRKHHTRRTFLKVGLAGLGLAGLTATGVIVVVITSQPASQFNVYTDAGNSGNHYVPSGFIGDFGDIILIEDWTDHPHSGTTCIRVVYSGHAMQGNRWAGVFWQDPPNNWGTLPGGYDLSHYSKLSFWVRGQSGGEQIHFFVGGIQGSSGDSLQPTLYARTDDTDWITLTTSWQLVTIKLKGQNLTHIIGAFGWSTNNDVNPHGAIFYLDDIVYLV